MGIWAIGVALYLVAALGAVMLVYAACVMAGRANRRGD